VPGSLRPDSTQESIRATSANVSAASVTSTGDPSCRSICAREMTPRTRGGVFSVGPPRQYFRILTQQGKNAPGGAYNYVINGRMTAGFAMIAYPAAYGQSGVMTLIVSLNGVVVRARPRAQYGEAGARHQDLRPEQGLERRQARMIAQPHSTNWSITMRISILLAAIVSAFALTQPATAQTTDSAMTSTPGKVGVSQAIEVSATITAIDKATRAITLKGPKGNEVTIVAGPEVRNFAQLKVGDTVNMKYYESLALDLKKGGGLKVEKTAKGGAVGAKPGDTPAGAAGRQITVVGDVIALDAVTQTVTVKGPQRTVNLKARDPEQFKLIAVGDQIQATYTEALAVAVTPVGKPADKAAPKK
jgi:Protein of unknown function (DUF2950)